MFFIYVLMIYEAFVKIFLFCKAIFLIYLQQKSIESSSNGLNLVLSVLFL